MAFIEITTDGYPPVYVTAGWLTVCIPVALLVTSCFLRSSPPERRNRLSRSFFMACHAQFLVFACAQMADFLLNVVFRFQPEFAQMSAAHLAMLRVNMSHTFVALDLQLFITLVCGVGIAVLLHRYPGAWKPIPSIAGMALVAAAQGVSYWTLQMARN